MSLPLAFENAGLPASVESMVEALGQASIDTDGGLNGRDLLKLDKNEGVWLFGQDAIELEEDALIAVNPASFCQGFISWAKKGGNILGEVMVPITHPAPQRSTLENTGEKWDEQLSFEAQIVTGEDKGVLLLYKSTAHGGKAFIRSIMRRIVSKMADGKTYIVPTIKLSCTSYDHKSWGTVFKPEYSIAYWLSYSGDKEGEAAKAVSAPPQTAKDQEPEIEEETIQVPVKETAQEAPARRTRRRRGEAQSEPAQEAAPTEEAPQRRRRRRSAS